MVHWFLVHPPINLLIHWFIMFIGSLLLIHWFTESRIQIHWIIGDFIDSLINCFMDSSIHRLASSLVYRPLTNSYSLMNDVMHSVHWFFDSSSQHPFADWLLHWFTDSLFHRLIVDAMIDAIELLILWLSGSLFHSMIHWFLGWFGPLRMHFSCQLIGISTAICSLVCLATSTIHCFCIAKTCL